MRTIARHQHTRSTPITELGTALDAISRSLESVELSRDALGVRLPAGLHEWCAHSECEDRERGDGPPLGVLLGYAQRAAARGVVVWVGRGVGPYPHALVHRTGIGSDLTALGRSLFVGVERRAERVWAIEVSLRCPGVALVIGDGRGLTMAESRRLQLVASSCGGVALVARSASEIKAISAARTRWSVAPCVVPDRARAWRVELLRCKGLRPTFGDARRWVVQRDHATGAIGEWQACDVGVAAEVVERPAATPGSRIA
ncbi:MAG: hypothetical protein AAGK04_11920 [Planctomycetota bacterium]